MGLKAYWSEHDRIAAERDPGDALRTHAWNEPAAPARRRNAFEFVVMIAIALLVASLIAVWPPSSTTQIATESESTPRAPAVKDSCTGETWPYLSPACLRRPR